MPANDVNATPVHEFYFFVIATAIGLALFSGAGLWPLVGSLGGLYYTLKFLNGLRNDGPTSPGKR